MEWYEIILGIVAWFIGLCLFGVSFDSMKNLFFDDYEDPEDIEK